MKELRIKRKASLIHKTLANILQSYERTIQNNKIILTIMYIKLYNNYNQANIYIKVFPNYKYKISKNKIKLYKKKLSQKLKNSIKKIPNITFIQI